LRYIPAMPSGRGPQAAIHHFGLRDQPEDCAVALAHSWCLFILNL
jgi:hypothetical protein